MNFEDVYNNKNCSKLMFDDYFESRIEQVRRAYSDHNYRYRFRYLYYLYFRSNLNVRIRR